VPGAQHRHRHESKPGLNRSSGGAFRTKPTVVRHGARTPGRICRFGARRLAGVQAVPTEAIESENGLDRVWTLPNVISFTRIVLLGCFAGSFSALTTG